MVDTMRMVGIANTTTDNAVKKDSIKLIMRLCRDDANIPRLADDLQ
jgi:hypothetical protein